MERIRAVGVCVLCVGLQRMLADLLLGSAHLVLWLVPNAHFCRMTLLPSFWPAMAVLSGGLVGGVLFRDVLRQHVRSSHATLLLLAGVAALLIATSFGTSTNWWQAWTPSRLESRSAWACLALDTAAVAIGLWLLRGWSHPNAAAVA
jgi:hypothetical protein